MAGSSGAVAILGAGIAGAAAARALVDAGIPVALFDKSRGIGGRMATRRADVTFDHGAQYFRARDPAFAAAIADAAAAGTVARWDTVRGEPPAMVATPTMTALARHIARGIPATLSFQATALQRDASGWRLRSDGGDAGPFSAVLVAIPSVQAIPLLERHHAAFTAAARVASYAPCWAGLFAFEPEALDRLRSLPHDAFAGDGIAWAAHDGGKPGRGGAPTLVLHANPMWSQAHLDEAKEAVRDRFLAILARHGWPAPTAAEAHRWRYAMVTEAAAVDVPFDAAAGLGIAGDWLAGPRVEAAFLSGLRAAAALLAAR